MLGFSAIGLPMRPANGLRDRRECRVSHRDVTAGFQERHIPGDIWPQRARSQATADPWRVRLPFITSVCFASANIIPFDSPRLRVAAAVGCDQPSDDRI